MKITRTTAIALSYRLPEGKTVRLGIGATTKRLFIGVLLQALIIATISFIIGSGLAMAAAAALPAKVPLQLIPSRFISTFIGLLVAAILGSAISLRRVTKVEPASAIGSAS